MMNDKLLKVRNYLTIYFCLVLNESWKPKDFKFYRYIDDFHREIFRKSRNNPNLWKFTKRNHPI